MKILHVYSGNLFGGIESALVTLAKRRERAPSLEPSVALCFEGRLRQQLAATGIDVHMLPAPRASQPLSVRRARRALADLLAHGSYDAVICHAAWSQAFFGAVVQRAALPLVFWAHDAVTGRHWTERLAKRVVPDLAICNSAYTASTLTALYPRVPSVVVANPVDAAPVSRPAADGLRLRQSLETSAASIVIIQTSRLEAWKGHGVLIDALARLPSHLDWTCWIAGGAQRPHEADYVASLRARADRSGIAGRLRWLGQRDDVRTLLAAADIHCQPNTAAEPFGIALVEALAAGLPVVTTRLGGAAEIVDEYCGRLVPAGDAVTLAAALQELIEAPALRRRLGERGPARARELCDPAVQLQRLATVLEGVLPVPAAPART